MSNKHTPEPWFVREFGTHTDRPSYFVMMSQTKGLFQTSDKSLSNRIVACVNACAGMDDPEAEIQRMRAEQDELVEYLKGKISNLSEDYAACKEWYESAYERYLKDKKNWGESRPEEYLDASLQADNLHKQLTIYSEIFAKIKGGANAD